MPVRKVKGGYRYGNSGKVYKSKAKAVKQGKAIKASQAVDIGRGASTAPDVAPTKGDVGRAARTRRHKAKPKKYKSVRGGADYTLE